MQSHQVSESAPDHHWGIYVCLSVFIPDADRGRGVNFLVSLCFTCISMPSCFSSLRSVIEKPPITGKELLPLTTSQLAGFRLHPGQVCYLSISSGHDTISSAGFHDTISISSAGFHDNVIYWHCFLVISEALDLAMAVRIYRIYPVPTFPDNNLPSLL